jgi:hypothetical protein
VSYTLEVEHAENYGNKNDVGAVTLTLGGTCTITLDPSKNLTLDTFDAGNVPCLPAAVSSNFSATYTVSAARNKGFTPQLDGVRLTVNYTPPVVRAQSVSGPFLSVGVNKAVLVLWGTLYAPLASVAADFKNNSLFEFRRGVIARSIATDAVPPSDSSSSFCLGYGSPCTGPSRVLRFTARTTDGTVRLVAVVRFFDSPSLGYSVKVLSWNRVVS